MSETHIESERSYKIIREAYKDSMQTYQSIKKFLEGEELIPKTTDDSNIVNRLCNMIYSSEAAIQIMDTRIRKHFGMSLNQFISEYSYEVLRDRAVNEILKYKTYSSFIQSMKSDKLPFRIDSCGNVVLSHNSLWALSNHAKWLLAQQGVAVIIG